MAGPILANNIGYVLKMYGTFYLHDDNSVLTRT